MKIQNLILSLVGISLAVGFQNCSSGFKTISGAQSSVATDPIIEVLPGDPNPTTPPASGTTLPKKNWTGLHYVTSNGTVAPQYYKKLEYQFDFQAKSGLLTTTVGGGAQTSAVLPLSDTDIANFKSLLGKLVVSNCNGSDMLLGGGENYLSLYTTTLSTVDTHVDIGACTGVNYKASVEAGKALVTLITNR